MMKFITSCVVVLSIFFITTASSYAQTITTLQEKVIDYQLPYPGLLPDNPLYFVKQMRNSLMLFMAADQSKKNEVNLQIVDKNLAASVELAKKGKHKLSVSMAEQSEDGFKDIVEKVKADKDKNKNKDFIEKLKKSNLKHRETIEDLMKDMPQGQVELMQKLREKNMDIGKTLQKM